MLWFDVGIETYTTQQQHQQHQRVLWFDVGIETYTTSVCSLSDCTSCGLM